MPKFDWTQVKGYRDGMTAEERLALLEAEDAIPEAAPSVSKAVFDNTASELAKVKKQLREKQTADEAAEAERAERDAAIQQELTDLRREKTLSTHKASFLALGYDEKLAAEAAEAMTDGKTADVFAAIGRNLETVKKNAETAALDGTARPPAGDPPAADNADLRSFMGLPDAK